MKGSAILVGASTVLLLGSGCAESASGNDLGPAGQAKQPAVRQPASPGAGDPPRHDHGPPQGAIEVPEGDLDAVALPNGYPKHAWVADGGTTLAVSAREGGCGRSSIELGSQEQRTVDVTLVETKPAGKLMCTMDMRYPVLTATLSAPLGDRTVVLHSEKRQH